MPCLCIGRRTASTNSLAPAGLISFGTYTPRLRVWLYSRAASRLKRVFQRELHFPGRLCREDLTEQVITDIHECRDRARYRIRCGCNQRDKAVRHVERIRANLDRLLFSNLEISRQRHIQTPVRWTNNAVPSEIPHGAQ